MLRRCWGWYKGKRYCRDKLTAEPRGRETHDCLVGDRMIASVLGSK